MNEIKNATGLLFVGDPHIWSKGPGKRLDKDVFADVVLGKIRQAVNIAVEKNLYLVFLGDLFHVHTENNIELLTKLTRELKKLPFGCLTIEGNHEKSQTKLSDDVALSLLKEAGVISVIEKNGLWGKFKTPSGESFLLGGTPYGSEIPNELSIQKKWGWESGEGKVIWLTHHNLDFGDSYPGVEKLKEIVGVDVLVNGHIHSTKPGMILGNMRAYNPGNITRLSVDCEGHIPRVWHWEPSFDKEIQPIDLKVSKNVFDLTGRQILVDDVKPEVPEHIEEEDKGMFVERMVEQAKQDPLKTDDGVYLKDNIKALVSAMDLSDSFLREMLEMVDVSLEQRAKV